MKKGTKTSWMKMPAAAFATLSFGELAIEDCFICLPAPGDNQGDGGLRVAHSVFIKTHSQVTHPEGKESSPYGENDYRGRAMSIKGGILSDFPLSMPVILLA